MSKYLSWIEKMELLNNIDMQHLKIINPDVKPNFIGPLLPDSKPHFPNYLRICGKFLHAKMKIPNGHTIVETIYENLDHKNWCIKTPLGNFFTHSYDPNTSFRSGKKDKIRIVAIRNILEGEVLTINYQ